MSQKILVLVGSPRKNANTETLADVFIKGAKEAGNVVTKYSVHAKNLKGCLDCGYCKTHTGCAVKDDMSEVYALLAEADMVVFASPIYFYDFSTQMKAIFDRLHNPIRDTFHFDKSALLAVCGDTGAENFEAMKLMYQANADYLNWEVKGMVLVDGVEAKGAINDNPKLDDAYKLGLSIV